MKFGKKLLCLAMLVSLAASPAQAAGADARSSADYGKAMLSMTPLSDSDAYLQNLSSAASILNSLNGYRNSAAMSEYANAMTALFSEDFAAAESGFAALTGNDSLNADLVTWNLPDVESLLLYTQARTQEASGAINNAITLYRQMPDIALFGASSTVLTLRMRQLSVGDPKSFTLNTNSLELTAGDAAQLFVNLDPIDACPDGLVWESMNPQCASVDSNGLVSAVSEGVAEITVTAPNGVQQSCSVTVSPKPIPDAISVKFNATALDMELGSIETLLPITEPLEAAAGLTWQSTEPDIASVNNGTVVALREGTTVITAASPNGVLAACVVTVRPAAIHVASISLNTSNVTLAAGEQYMLTANVLPSNATDPTLVWTSANPSVATVSGGVITGVSEGMTTITATAESGVCATCNVLVEKPVKSISEYRDTYAVDRSSAYRNKSTSISVEAQCAVDGNVNTAWNTNSKWDGEWICLTVKDNEEYRVSRLGFYNGYVKSNKVFRENPRIKELDVYCDGHFVQTLHLKDTMDYQECMLSEPMIGSEFRFIIRSIYSGSKYKDCALSELYLMD